MFVSIFSSIELWRTAESCSDSFALSLRHWSLYHEPFGSRRRLSGHVWRFVGRQTFKAFFSRTVHVFNLSWHNQITVILVIIVVIFQSSSLLGGPDSDPPPSIDSGRKEGSIAAFHCLIASETMLATLQSLRETSWGMFHSHSRRKHISHFLGALVSNLDGPQKSVGSYNIWLLGWAKLG